MQSQDRVILSDWPSEDTSPPAPGVIYAQRCQTFASQRDAELRVSQRAGVRNVVLFFAALACLLVAAFGGNWLFFGFTVLLVAAFVASFAHLGRINLLVRRYSELFKINEEGQSRLRRDWKSLPLRRPKGAAPRPSYAGDLDLLGHASLQHLLSTPTTGGGLATLESWLLTPAAAEEIRERQKVVAELAPRVEFRDQFALSGRLMGDAESVYEVFLRWAEGPSWLARRSQLLWLSRILPVVILGLMVAEIARLTPYPFWLLPLAGSILLSSQQGKIVEEILDQVSDRQRVFEPYCDLFALVSGQSFNAPALRRLVDELTADGMRADTAMRQLSRIMQFGDMRRSMIFPVIQAFLLWNFHTLWLLEGWQRRVGHHARAWLTALGTLEAYTALATLCFDHPEWAFPDVTPGGANGSGSSVETTPVFSGRDVGHPLIPDDQCVTNDVSVGPSGTFLFVTGSNMSGKSTLLRAIGTNIVLAQAGAPVCASQLRITPIELATSIRVQDSLEEGISYYMAELQRLKEVVDEADAERAPGERTVLFLLDEILHGTNTSERQIAARRIIRHLLAVGATGVVSTHDLTLADPSELTRRSTLVHFTEHFERGEDGRPIMTFDYKLRPGIATSTNALKLMEIVGLPLGDETVTGG
jgi:MutS domain V